MTPSLYVAPLARRNRRLFGAEDQTWVKRIGVLERLAGGDGLGGGGVTFHDQHRIGVECVDGELFIPFRLAGATTPGEGAFLPTLQYAEFSNRWEVMNVTKGVRNILKNW